MTEPELFRMPILGYGQRDLKSYPFTHVLIPVFCEPQALRNHSQTLSRLRQRGGLGPCEACAILDARQWHKMTNEETIARLTELNAGRNEKK